MLPGVVCYEFGYFGTINTYIPGICIQSAAAAAAATAAAAAAALCCYTAAVAASACCCFPSSYTCHPRLFFIQTSVLIAVTHVNLIYYQQL